MSWEEEDLFICLKHREEEASLSKGNENPKMWYSIFMARHTMIPSVYILFLRDNTIVLLRRRNTGYEDGKYSLPAGHVEDGESLKEAACREAFEEVRVRMKPKDLQLAHVMRRNISGDDRIDFFYETRTWSGKVRNGEPEKCDELIWTDMDDLPENTIPYIKEFMRQYKHASPFSELAEKK